jgi:RIO kinase 1
MPRINPKLYLDEDFEYVGEQRQRRKEESLPVALRDHERSDHAVLDEILRYSGAETVGAEEAFSPTFSSSRHEREWILTYLGAFYDRKLIADVLRKAKGGKEATVYCCQAHPDTGLELLAAKIYRPRMFRNLRNDAQYRQRRDLLDDQGKVIRDRRLLLAVSQGTARGKLFQHTSWLQHEYQTLELLHQAGLDVPRPVEEGNNTILMEYLGDKLVTAPALTEVSLGRTEARAIFERLLWNVERMLALHRVHGDLSAYNVLYWQGQVKLIDFPQAIDPRQNPDAEGIFRRDVLRLCQYFKRYGIATHPARLAEDLWVRYGLPGSATLEEDTDKEPLE